MRGSFEAWSVSRKGATDTAKTTAMFGTKGERVTVPFGAHVLIWGVVMASAFVSQSVERGQNNSRGIHARRTEWEVRRMMGRWLWSGVPIDTDT